MNIAFFCDTYQPTRNGVAVSVCTTTEELRARGHRVVIFAPRYKGYKNRDPNVLRFPAGHWFRAKDFPVAWPLLPYFSARAFWRFQSEHFDIIHSHSPFTLGTLGARWAQALDIPVIFTFHTLYHRYLHYAPLPSGLSRSYINTKVRNYCHLCDHVIAPSHAIARVVQRFRPDAPITILPTGIDVEHFASGNRETARAAYGIGEDEVVLLYVGRLAYEKNLDFLMRAVAPILRQSTPVRVRLMMVGGGPAVTSLQTLAQQLKIEDKVIFTGFVDGKLLPDHYAAGDIFTFASRTETQGVSIAEALAAGLPCVIVGAMGAAEAVAHGHNGLVVPPHQERFGEAVSQLVNDPQLRLCMAQNARADAPTLSLQHRVDTLLDLYDSVRSTHSHPQN